MGARQQTLFFIQISSTPDIILHLVRGVLDDGVSFDEMESQVGGEERHAAARYSVKSLGEKHKNDTSGEPIQIIYVMNTI